MASTGNIKFSQVALRRRNFSYHHLARAEEHHRNIKIRRWLLRSAAVALGSVGMFTARRTFSPELVAQLID
ncbi:uncharacterized protein BKA78DRAFT_351632 [Phyllosticta capitalensis]|uniref:uncharacterized protein n=1 Tax=Phyllosticta capitalensis TaxID=121624 RepID=UPI00312DBBC4